MMKLKDCDCGGAAKVTYDTNGNGKFVVGCIACGNQTPSCESVEEAVTLWNKTYCCALIPYNKVSA